MGKFPRQEQVEGIDYCQTKIDRDDDPSSFGKFRSKFIRRSSTQNTQTPTECTCLTIFLS